MVIDRTVGTYYENRGRVLKTIKDVEEKKSFVFDTFLTFQKDGWRVAANRPVCMTLEECLNSVDLDCLLLVLKVLSKDIAGVIRSKFCHHLLHKVLVKCQAIPFCEDPLILDFVTIFLHHVRDHLDTYMNHEYGQHSVRLYLQLLAGVEVEKNALTNTYGPDCLKLHQPLDPDHVSTLQQLIDRMLLNPDVYAYSRNETISPLIQILLLVVSVRHSKFIKHTLDNFITNIGMYSKAKKKQLLPDGFVHPVLVYVTELLVSLMHGKQFAHFLTEMVNPNVPDSGETSTTTSSSTRQKNPIQLMTTHPIASCVFRSILRRLRKSADFEAILAVLNQQMESPFRPIFDAGQYAVITELSTVCASDSFAQFQPTFLKMLYSSFGHTGKKPHASSGEDSLIQCVVGMIPSDQLSSSQSPSDLTQPVTLPGCLLAQTLLNYAVGRPSVLAAGLCTLSKERLLAWAKHNMLSRVLEALFQSNSVPDKRKFHILSLFENDLVQLACDRFGSRIVESLWAMLDLDQHADVTNRFVSKLASAHKKLSSHSFGHFIHYKLMLDLYVNAPDVWKKRITRPHHHPTGSKRSHPSTSQEPRTGKKPKTPIVH